MTKIFIQHHRKPGQVVQGPASRRQTVLIVSADGQQAKLIFDYLEDAGYQAQIAGVGENTLETIRKEKPALLVLDWRLPGINSLALIRAIRSDEQIANLPLILMNGCMGEEDILSGLEAGADICLAETLQPKVFIARVHSLLRRSAK